MAEIIQPGDLVFVKSGGPAMTVDDVDGKKGSVSCTWFDGNKRISDVFSHHLLTKENPTEAIKRMMKTD